jgi:hypothetical protein
MSPDEASLNQLNLIFEEAVYLHGGDLKKVVNHIKTRIGASSRRDRADIDRVFERMLAFHAPDFRSQPLN